MTKKCSICGNTLDFNEKEEVCRHCQASLSYIEGMFSDIDDFAC